MNSEKIYWRPFRKEQKSKISICPATGLPHQTRQITYVKNCDFFPEGHPEFLHCDSCRAMRCKDCGDPRTWKFKS